MTKFRITVRGDDIELRGYLSGIEATRELADAVKPFGWIVVASVSEDQDKTPVKLFQAQYGPDAGTTVENHLARLLELIGGTPGASRLIVANQGETWMVSVEQTGADQVMRTGSSAGEALHLVDEATS